jgi:hypothetical protein
MGVNVIDYFLNNIEPAGIKRMNANIKGLEGEISKYFSGPQPPTPTLTSLIDGTWKNLHDDYIGHQAYSSNVLNAQQLSNYESYLTSHIALGCMGAITAYMITRPGFLPALMQMAGVVAGDIAKLLPMVV